MAKRKKKGPTWSDVKAALGNLDKKQLLKLVADLYRLSGENKTFLYSRFGGGDNPLGPYKKIIEECMCPNIYSNKPIQVSKVLTLSRERQDEFKNRLEAIMTSSSNIGWGYHDMLCDDYYRAFPEGV